jgi:hypothetical protein
MRFGNLLRSSVLLAVGLQSFAQSNEDESDKYVFPIGSRTHLFVKQESLLTCGVCSWVL